MRTPLALLIAITLLCSLPSTPSTAQNATIQNSGTTTSATITVPAGAPVTMAATRPVWSSLVQPGDPFYAETTAPVIVGGQNVIPAGTYLEGSIEAFTKPGKAGQAIFHLQFETMIFADGYTVPLRGPDGKQPVRALVSVKVDSSSDILFDNGTQLTFVWPTPLTLDATLVNQAIPLSNAPAGYEAATLCRPTPGDPGDPGSPGTPDTVIPGNPGTPDTVISGVDGAPDTVIPGIPATPDTVIPGTPATAPTPPTPPTFCPDPPTVISSVLDTAPETFLPAPAQTAVASASTEATLPSGTVALLTLVTPINKKVSKPGDAVRATIAFPVAVGEQVALPAGTLAEGQITTITKRAKNTGQPSVQVNFNKLVFANGYTTPLSAGDTSGFSPASVEDFLTARDVAMLPPPPAPVKTRGFLGLFPHMKTPSAPKVLIAPGWQFQMTLAAPLTLDSAKVSAAAESPETALAPSL